MSPMSRIAAACAGYAAVVSGLTLDEGVMKPSIQDPYLEKHLNADEEIAEKTQHTLQEKREMMEVVQNQMAQDVERLANQRLGQTARESHSRADEEMDAESRRDARLAELKKEEEQIKEMRLLAQEQLEAEKKEIAVRASIRAALRSHKDEMAHLVKEAEARRQMALEHVSPQQAFGRLTLDEINAIPSALQILVHNPYFMGTMKASTDMLKESTVNYTLAARAQIETFVQTYDDITSDKFFPALANVFDDTWELLMTHQTDTLDAVSRVEKVVPAKVNATVTPLLTNLALSITPREYNTTQLASMTAKSYSCDEISKIMSDYTSKLTMARNAANTTNALAPVMTTLLNKKLVNLVGGQTWSSGHEVTSFFQEMLRLGYVEMVGLEQFSQQIIEKLGPVLSDRLHCTWSSSHGLRFSALVAAMSIAMCLFKF